MSVVVNKLLPEFEAKVTGGGVINNGTHLGKALVLYFYPKDFTPGCTVEAEQFSSYYADFTQIGVEVLGVSRDNNTSHEGFRCKHNIPFGLIADTEEKLCHMFGVVKNKIMYGKKVKGIERSTFLIDNKGFLRREWRGVKVEGHVAEVLEAAQALSQEKSLA